MRLPILFAALIASCGIASASEMDLEPWQVAALSDVRSWDAVVEALFPQGATGSFWVSVYDDGSRRDGYAESICLALGGAGRPNGKSVIIHVFDAAAMYRKEMKELGYYICDTTR